MSSRAHALHFILAVSIASLTAPVLAAQQPAVDAEGRIFGDTINDPLPEWKSAPTAHAQPQLPPVPTGYSAIPMDQSAIDRAAWEEDRADWLAECRQRYGGGRKVAGGVVGGLFDGIAGSAIAGRGHRTIGAVVGGVTGAIAGAAIGDSTDRRRARDYCESYLDRYFANYNRNYGAYGAYAGNQPYGYPQGQLTYGYAMQPMMVLVPVAMTAVAAAPQQGRQVVQVIEEWVTVSRPARRYIPKRATPHKRIPVVRDKRIRVY